MAKRIATYIPVRVRAVTLKTESDRIDRQWRKEYIGAIGQLDIFESTGNAEGKIFAYFNSTQTGYLKTNFGKYTIKNNILTFTTPKTIYEFEILS